MKTLHSEAIVSKIRFYTTKRMKIKECSVKHLAGHNQQTVCRKHIDFDFRSTWIDNEVGDIDEE